MKYRFLREGQFVRIRSATLEHHQNSQDGKTFGLKNYSNILSLPQPSAITQGMKFDLEATSHAYERAQLLQPFDAKLMHPIVISKVNHKGAMPLTSLDKLLNEEPVVDKLHKVRINLLLTKPQVTAENLLSLLRVYNKKTHAYHDYKQGSAVKKDEQLTLAFTGYAQDYSLQLSNQVAVVKIDDKLFASIKCEDLAKKPASAKIVHNAIANMTRFNVWLEAIVAFNKDGLLEVRDTELKQY